ncbi:DUF4159 domain-containing protein [Sneathiella sp.]|uniref:DUF4159 domain-containing protein n=1 Tax=Sneathiella sp. TaxID=1964365 RepID=UPI003569CF6B
MALLTSLSFLYPWVLTALLTLPVIWWLLRLIPPQPKTVIFPAIRFLYQLKKEEQTTATTPWWLLLLRLLLAAIIIISVSGPGLNFTAESEQDGPLVVIVDDGWTAAETWESLKATLSKILTETARNERQIYIVTTAGSAQNSASQLTPLPDREALGMAASLAPKSWPSDHSQLLKLLPQIETLDNPEFVWLSGGLIQEQDEPDLNSFFTAIAKKGPVTIFQAQTVIAPPIIGIPKIMGETLVVPLTLATGVPAFAGNLTALAASGQILASAPVDFNSETEPLNVTLDVPNKVRNEIARLTIAGTRNAAATFLLDQRWQRRQIGLVSSDFTKNAQPLLNENHYLTEALSPFYDIERGTLEDLAGSDVLLIALGDTANLPEGLEKSLTGWIEKGGILIRFAGPKLANSDTTLVPVELRSGNRSLQGAMSWNRPARLGPIPPGSPFSSLTVPEDVRVRTQILANPTPDLLGKTWAQLADGTPLVTAAKQGRGWLVLFHTTATPDWSNLSLSGFFVEMLRDIGNLGQFSAENTSFKRTLPPFQLLDGFGKLTTDVGIAKPIATDTVADMTLDADHPPGLYGDKKYGITVNIGQFDTPYSIVDPQSYPATVRTFDTARPFNLAVPLLIIALILILADQLISLFLQGKLPLLSRVTGALLIGALVSLTMFSTANRVQAQTINGSSEEKILAATLDTRLGYIVTHDQATDAMSRAGLTGLSQQLLKRTSIEAKEPLSVDIEQDELIFYPLIYWPITVDLPPLSEQAVLKLDDYFNGGGTILFDTRNQNSAGFGRDLSGSPENIRLRQLLARLDIPRVQPVPVDHVVTRSFYLMQTFPGRYAGGELWIEDTTDSQGNDGVASILIGSNDWAAAWAIGENGNPIAATIPADPRQRELAYRFGINLVMYTLTGNYKADQVHIPAILERLGQ